MSRKCIKYSSEVLLPIPIAVRPVTRSKEPSYSNKNPLYYPVTFIRPRLRCNGQLLLSQFLINLSEPGAA